MELRQALFWDVRPENIDLDKNASHVVERVLEHGNDRDVRELLHICSKQVLSTLCTLPQITAGCVGYTK